MKTNELNGQSSNGAHNADMINGGANGATLEDVDLFLEAVLGGTSLTVKELRGLGSGSVIELEASLNQSIELRLNGVSIAKGELVAVGDKFGVRIHSTAS